MHNLAKLISDATRPLVLVGNGVHCANAVKEFRRWVRRISIPVVHSLLAVDVLPYTDPFRVGMIGSYGNRYANYALAASDLLIVLGSRLDVRQTGSDLVFFGNRKILHVDCCVENINCRVTGCTELVSDLKSFIDLAFDTTNGIVVPRAWHVEIQVLKTLYPDIDELKTADDINPNVFMHKLSRASLHTEAYIVDVGQHQMWAAQSLELRHNQRFITSGGMGAMGFALPAAIGASFAANSCPVVMIAGDGGFQCNIQELETVVRNKLPIKMVVLNNRCHGMVRQFQESYFQSIYQSTVIGYSTPPFCNIAAAYGIDNFSVHTNTDVDKGLTQMWENPRKPFFLEVDINPSLNVYPKLTYGSPLNKMEVMEPME